MKIEAILDAVTKFFSGNGNAQAVQMRLNRGVLDVAMMISAIDGEILPAEIAAYNRLLGECREASKADVPAATEDMMRKVAFLSSLKQSGISDRECVVSFVREAKSRMPEGFASGTAADKKRALVFWTMMALSDGNFAPLERAAVHAVAECFAPELCGEFLDCVEGLVRGLSDSSHREEVWRKIEELVARN